MYGPPSELFKRREANSFDLSIARSEERVDAMMSRYRYVRLRGCFATLLVVISSVTGKEKVRAQCVIAIDSMIYLSGWSNMSD